LNDGPMFQQPSQSRIRSRSMGLKLFIVCGLALVMTIPAFFVDDLVDERTHRANDVVKEISSHVGGQQTFLGPTLAIPYTVPATSADLPNRHGIYLVFPTQGSATVKTQTTERRRSLFKVPVFQADLNFAASFDLSGVTASVAPNVDFDWSHAEFIVGVSDARGALSDGTLTIDGKTLTLAPADISQSLTLGEDQTHKTSLSLRSPGSTNPAQYTVQCNCDIAILGSAAHCGARVRKEHAPFGSGRLGESQLRRWIPSSRAKRCGVRVPRRLERSFHRPWGAS